MWRSEGSSFWPESGTFTCNDGQALRQAALTDVGIILQPYLLLADDIATGRLITVLEHITLAPRPIHMLWQQQPHASAKHSSFFNWINEKAPPVISLC
ncbi:hypothetical protein RCI35_001315 [Enterobacter hormaechei]|nr:hypothetical protein [Enterobacter hormaechei]